MDLAGRARARSMVYMTGGAADEWECQECPEAFYWEAVRTGATGDRGLPTAEHRRIPASSER